MPQSNRFWNRIARRYARQPVADEQSYQRKLHQTREVLRPDMNVLEFGCGTGSTALAHAPYVGQITAIDFSDRMIEVARSKATAAGVTNVQFDIATIEAFTAPNESFDAVLAMSVLHLLDSPEAALAKVFGLLKPGGVLAASTTCVGDMRNPVKYLLPLGHALRLLPLVRPITKDALVAMVTGAGFEIEDQWQPGPGKAVFMIARKPA
jgi:ubiquinone/menaquinone biosynthesis C-methylase UbiE